MPKIDIEIYAKKSTSGAIHIWCHSFRGRRESARRWGYSKSLFSKMGHKGEEGVKNLKKMGEVIYGWPLINWLVWLPKIASFPRFQRTVFLSRCILHFQTQTQKKCKMTIRWSFPKWHFFGFWPTLCTNIMNIEQHGLMTLTIETTF